MLKILLYVLQQNQMNFNIVQDCVHTNYLWVNNIMYMYS